MQVKVGDVVLFGGRRHRITRVSPGGGRVAMIDGDDNLRIQPTTNLREVSECSQSESTERTLNKTPGLLSSNTRDTSMTPTGFVVPSLGVESDATTATT